MLFVVKCNAMFRKKRVKKRGKLMKEKKKIEVKILIKKVLMEQT